MTGDAGPSAFMEKSCLETVTLRRAGLAVKEAVLGPGALQERGVWFPPPPSQPVFQSAVSPSLTSCFLSPRLLKSPPFFTYLFLCPSFLGSSPSSFKVLVWVPRILPKPLAGLRVGGFCYEGQRPHHKPLLGFREGENHGRPDSSSAIRAPLVPHF